MQDKATQGFIAGILGVTVQAIFILTMYYGFGFTKYRLLDFVGVVTFNQIPSTLPQAITSELIVYVYSGFLGVIFVMLLNVLGSKNLITKGIFFGALHWFFINAFVTAFKIEGLYPTNFVTVIVHLVGGLLYGTTMACSYIYLAEKYILKKRQVSFNPIPQPSMKYLDKENQKEE